MPEFWLQPPKYLIEISGWIQFKPRHDHNINAAGPSDRVDGATTGNGDWTSGARNHPNIERGRSAALRDGTAQYSMRALRNRQQIHDSEHLGSEAIRVRNHVDPKNSHVARIARNMAISPLARTRRHRQTGAMHTRDALDDFEMRTIELNGESKQVHVAGSGPAVIVMTEMPGISPDVARFARWVRDAGFTVFMPSLFGDDGAVPEVDSGIAVFQRACVSAEFRALTGGETSPVVHWLRALARLAHKECGGPGVGAIGMCFTGNFALTMMLEPAVLAPVLSQPSLPLNEPAGLEISPEDLAVVRHRLDRDNLTVRAYRFAGDRFCTAQRFAAYAEALGNAFEPRVLLDEAANPSPPPFFANVVASPHSVVTAHLIDEAGQPTIAARDEIIDFFVSRLITAGTQ
jgi:dienelactone hydrolase